MKKKYVELTPAQIELIELIKHSEVKYYYTSLEKVHYSGTYLVNSELADLSASAYVHQLIDVFQKIVVENLDYGN